MVQSGHMEQAGTEVIKALDAARLIKEETVRREGIGADIPMMLHLRKEGLSLGIAPLLGPRDEVLDLVVQLVGLGEADQVVHVCDAYGIQNADWYPDLNDLAKAFAAGDTNVYECLQVVSVRHDGSMSSLHAPYHYDGRKVAWDETVDIFRDDDPDLTVGGDYPAAMMQGFALQSIRPVRALNPQELSAITGCTFIAPVMVKPPRNKPCPCGSGRKAKICCWG